MRDKVTWRHVNEYYIYFLAANTARNSFDIIVFINLVFRVGVWQIAILVIYVSKIDLNITHNDCIKLYKLIDLYILCGFYLFGLLKFLLREVARTMAC